MKYEQIRLEVPESESSAELSVYLLDPVSVAPEKKRPMVVVVPGGGYRFCSDRESEPIAMQFLSMGCHACVLNYSVAPARFPTALQELALAVSTVREHAESWHVDEQAVLVCGFSAGGHLSGSLGAFWNRDFVYKPIGKTPELIRPNGLILCYPVITSGEYRHPGSFDHLLGEHADPKQLELVSLEKQVTDAMPPVFLWHTVTDGTVPVENSLLMASALQKQHISFELHLYPSGVHGLALASEETAGNRRDYVEPGCQTWISLVQSWIENRYVSK